MEWWNLLCQRSPPQLPKVPCHSKIPLPSDSEDEFPSPPKRKRIPPVLPTPIKSGPAKGKGKSKRVKHRLPPPPPSNTDSDLDLGDMTVLQKYRIAQAHGNKILFIFLHLLYTAVCSIGSIRRYTITATCVKK